MKENTAILVVSFGTGFYESHRLTIGAIEDAIAGAFPNYDVRRALAGRAAIDRLQKRGCRKIDNVEEALERALNEGIANLAVQPTYFIAGYEYAKLEEMLNMHKKYFQQISLGQPLLMEDADFDAVIKAAAGSTASFDDGSTAICFVGHGTQAESNRAYAKLQMKLKRQGFDNYYIGTLKARPSLKDIIDVLEEKSRYRRVVLAPLMVSAGCHACRDIAGNQQGSWKTALGQRGYEVTCILEGLGQNAAVRDVYVEHARRALESLKK